MLFLFFFFNDTATTEIYTLSLHDALPIFLLGLRGQAKSRILRQLVTLLDEEIPILAGSEVNDNPFAPISKFGRERSEEHTSELQSLAYLVCRLLLEKKKTREVQQPHPVIH